MKIKLLIAIIAVIVFEILKAKGGTSDMPNKQVDKNNPQVKMTLTTDNKNKFKPGGIIVIDAINTDKLYISINEVECRTFEKGVTNIIPMEVLPKENKKISVGIESYHAVGCVFFTAWSGKVDIQYSPTNAATVITLKRKDQK